MTGKIGIAVVAAGLLLAACGGSGESGDGGQVDVAGERSGGEEGAALQEEQAQAGGVAAVVGGAPLSQVGPRVIKNAELSLEVERGEFKSALQQATAVAEAHGGFVLSSSVHDEDARRGSIVLRVPSDRFETALATLRDLGTVEGERVSGEDVGQEFVDLEARLRNLRAQEAVLLRLMDRAESVTDTIRVQRELTRVQLEIERIRGRLRYLEDQTALGTITVSLAEAGAAAPEEKGIVRQGWDRAVEGFLTVVGGAIAALGVLLPLGVLALAAWGVVRRLRPV